MFSIGLDKKYTVTLNFHQKEERSVITLIELNMKNRKINKSFYLVTTPISMSLQFLLLTKVLAYILI